MSEYHRGLLAILASAMKPTSYLELGLGTTPVLPSLAEHCTFLYGVDNSPTTTPMPNNATIFAMYTDDFFRTEAIQPPELVFVDADHRSAQVMKDLDNIEAICATNCIVVIHDTFPGHRDYMADHHCSDSYTVPPRLKWEHVTIPRHPGCTILRMKPAGPA